MYASRVLKGLSAPLDELLADLERVRAKRKKVEVAEQRARAEREGLEAEESALLQLISLVRHNEPPAEEAPRPAMITNVPASSLQVGQFTLQDLDLPKLNVGKITAAALVAAQQRRRTAAERPRNVPKRDLILKLMRDHPEREAWTSREVRDELSASGVDATTNLIGMTLRRMLDAGTLARLDDGRYALLPESGGTDMGVA